MGTASANLFSFIVVEIISADTAPYHPPALLKCVYKPLGKLINNQNRQDRLPAHLGRLRDSKSSRETERNGQRRGQDVGVPQLKGAPCHLLAGDTVTLKRMQGDALKPYQI